MAVHTQQSEFGTAPRAPKSGTAERLLFMLLVFPNLFLFFVFNYYPFLYNGYLSFVRWDMLAPIKPWVGLENYRYLFTNPGFGRIMTNTFVFTVSSVALIGILGLAMAMLLNQALRGRNVVRAIVFSPVMLSGAAIGMVWIYILDPRFGLLDVFIRALGGISPNWLLDVRWAMAALVMVYVWKNVGYSVVIFLAGLKAIPAELYEAARVDGAGGWARFVHVTLPGLSPVMFFLIVTSVLSSFQSFDLIQVMTGGGPVDATTTLIYYLYEEGFVGFNAGRAGVAAMVLFAIMLAFTLVQLRRGEKAVHYA